MERSTFRNILRNRKVAMMTLLSSLALYGCGNTLSTNDRPVGTCGAHDYSKASDSYTDLTPSQALAIARKDATLLQGRALQFGGSIDLPRYTNDYHDTTEIEATQDNLELQFDRSGAIAAPRIDHVNIPMNGQPRISVGAIMCFNNNDLTPNGTFASLQRYVRETNQLIK